MKGNFADDRKVRTLTRETKSGTVVCHFQKRDIVALFFTGRSSLLEERKRIYLWTVFGTTLHSHERVQNIPEGSASLTKHPLQDLPRRSKTEGFLFHIL